MATLKDLSELEKQRGFFVGSTNILIASTPVLKTDLVINLDENSFEYKPTELSKIAKIHTLSDKKFINGLVKEVADSDH
jgi:Transport protein Avl9